jgi:hypothetical protein
MEQTALIVEMNGTPCQQIILGRCQMTQCPKCRSTDTTASQPAVDAGVTIGLHTGGIGAAVLTIGALGPFAVIPLIAGALLGGCGGYMAGEAIDPRWKRVCNDCGCTWKQID